MALKPCRECGQEVSTEAKTCPNCGVKHPANKLAAMGDSLTTCGCLLTLFVTVPILFAFCLTL